MIICFIIFFYNINLFFVYFIIEVCRLSEACQKRMLFYKQNENKMKKIWSWNAAQPMKKLKFFNFKTTQPAKHKFLSSDSKIHLVNESDFYVSKSKLR